MGIGASQAPPVHLASPSGDHYRQNCAQNSQSQNAYQPRVCQRYEIRTYPFQPPFAHPIASAAERFSQEYQNEHTLAVNQQSSESASSSSESDESSSEDYNRNSCEVLLTSREAVDGDRYIALMEEKAVELEMLQKCLLRDMSSDISNTEQSVAAVAATLSRIAKLNFELNGGTDDEMGIDFALPPDSEEDCYIYEQLDSLIRRHEQVLKNSDVECAIKLMDFRSDMTEQKLDSIIEEHIKLRSFLRIKQQREKMVAYEQVMINIKQNPELYHSVITYSPEVQKATAVQGSTVMSRESVTAIKASDLGLAPTRGRTLVHSAELGEAPSTRTTHHITEKGVAFPPSAKASLAARKRDSPKRLLNTVDSGENSPQCGKKLDSSIQLIADQSQPVRSHTGEMQKVAEERGWYDPTAPQLEAHSASSELSSDLELLQQRQLSLSIQEMGNQTERGEYGSEYSQKQDLPYPDIDGKGDHSRSTNRGIHDDKKADEYDARGDEMCHRDSSQVLPSCHEMTDQLTADIWEHRTQINPAVLATMMTLYHDSQKRLLEQDKPKEEVNPKRSSLWAMANDQILHKTVSQSSALMEGHQKLDANTDNSISVHTFGNADSKTQGVQTTIKSSGATIETQTDAYQVDAETLAQEFFSDEAERKEIKKIDRKLVAKLVEADSADDIGRLLEENRKAINRLREQREADRLRSLGLLDKVERGKSNKTDVLDNEAHKQLNTIEKKLRVKLVNQQGELNEGDVRALLNKARKQQAAILRQRTLDRLKQDEALRARLAQKLKRKEETDREQLKDSTADQTHHIDDEFYAEICARLANGTLTFDEFRVRMQEYLARVEQLDPNKRQMSAAQQQSERGSSPLTDVGGQPEETSDQLNRVQLLVRRAHEKGRKIQDVRQMERENALVKLRQHREKKL